MFATVGPQGLEVPVVVPTEAAATARLAALLVTEPGSVAAVAPSFAAVAANAVMVAAFALIPAMRLIDQDADQHQRQRQVQEP